MYIAAAACTPGAPTLHLVKPVQFDRLHAVLNDGTVRASAQEDAQGARAAFPTVSAGG